MRVSKTNFQVQSSAQSNKKLHKKISQHIKQIVRQNNSVSSRQGKGKNAQKIAEKVIQKQKHKYLYKKAFINTKFQWLNKYLQTTQLKPLSLNIIPKKVNYSMLRDNNSRVSTLADKSLKRYSQAKYYDKKRCKRSRTQHVQIEQAWMENNCFNKQNQGGGGMWQQQQEKIIDQEQCCELLKEVNTNNNVLHSLENSSRLKKSNSTRKNGNTSVVRDQGNLYQILLRQKKKNIHQARRFSVSKILSNQENIPQKQSKILLAYPKNKLKVDKVCRKQNNPFAKQQFVEQSSCLQSSNLMSHKTSGCIKNRKRQHIYQSRQQKKQLSQFLKRKRKLIEEQITVQPWNLNGNEKQKDENQQNYFIMRNHR